MTQPKITTTFVYPPIPIRTMDWCAHYADDDEDPECPMPKGWGATEAEAVADLVDTFPREAFDHDTVAAKTTLQAQRDRIAAMAAKREVA